MTRLAFEPIAPRSCDCCGVEFNPDGDPHNWLCKTCTDGLYEAPVPSVPAPAPKAA